MSFGKDEKYIKKGILVTGAMGFLGMHIVKDLCFQTKKNVYCLIRGNSITEATEKLKILLYWYFKEEGELMRHALILFHDFSQKKKEGVKEKIESGRKLLPVTPFANAIVQTLREHRVLLIAGDTGCGKSTQGECVSRVGTV